MTKVKEKQNIPEGWVSKSVSNLCDNLDNKRVPVTKADRVSGDIPYYGATGIIDYVDNYIFDDEILLIGEDGADWSAFANTSFLVSGKSWVNNHAHVLKCKDGVMSPYLKEYFNWKNLDCYTTGGTRKKLNKEALMNIPVVLPESKREQQKIAEVLGAVDEEIEKTKKVIKATEKLKKGLMQNLFTRGIGYEKHKETKIGSIPEEWKLVTLGEIREFITSGSRGWAKYYSNKGALFIRVTNLSKFSKTIDLTDNKYVTVPEGGEGLRTKVQTGDILISITADLGRIGLVEEGLGDAYVNQHIALVRLNETKVRPDFVAEYLRTSIARKQFLSSNEGGTKLGLSLPTVDKTLVPVPSKKEQEKIAEILSAVDEKTAVNKKLLANQTELKKGLMQDLLSGVKRVII